MSTTKRSDTLFHIALFFFIYFRDIYTNDIELKISAIEKLTSRNADLLEQNRTLEQQLYDLQISNKNVVEEKDKHKNENIDLQKR